MPVPETSMDKNNCVVLSEYEIRLAWQVAYVQSVAISKSMKCLADKLLWLGIL